MHDESARIFFLYWLEKGNTDGEYTDGSKFFYFYLCLNVLMAHLSGENRDSRMLDWVKENESLVSESFNLILREEDVIAAINELKNRTPVYDARLGIDDAKVITDTTNLTEVLDVIYKIRCNFFHGNKMLVVDRNIKLIEISTKILERWMNSAAEIIR